MKFCRSSRDELIKAKRSLTVQHCRCNRSCVSQILMWNCLNKFEEELSGRKFPFPHSQDLFLWELTSTRTSLFLWGRAGIWPQSRKTNWQGFLAHQLSIDLLGCQECASLVILANQIINSSIPCGATFYEEIVPGIPPLSQETDIPRRL